MNLFPHRRSELDDPSPDQPILHGLTEVESIRDMLSADTINPDLRQEILGFESRIVRRHLRKVIIDYTLTFREGTKNYIGLYRESDERLGHTFTILKTLRANGFGEGSDLQVPNPILYLPSLSFILMERALGKTLRQIIEQKDHSISYASSVGRWLARLHNSTIAFDTVRSKDDQIAASLRYTRACAWTFPNLKSKIESISNSLVEAQQALPSEERTPIHGDYHPRNIIVSPSLTTVIDFEEAGMGDPAFDVGYFVAQTKMTHGGQDDVTQIVDAFRSEYQRKRQSVETDFEQRIAVFEAQTYLQRIYHTYYLLPLKPDRELASSWLDECQACLQRTQTGEKNA